MATDETQQRPHLSTDELITNKRVPNLHYYQPITEPSSGTPLSSSVWPQNSKLPTLFTPIKIKNLEIKNRIWVSPMCQYSCESGTGKLTDWHLVHLGSFARGGAGLIIVEASSVLPNGLISPEDSGLWSDDQIPALKRIVEFVHSQGSKIGIQLAHAGRKASVYAPWLTDGLVTKEKPNLKDFIVPNESSGWRSEVVGPSPIQFDQNHALPRELNQSEIDQIKIAYADATKRAHQAGFDLIEIHGAHGYLLHNFCSPLSNQRSDKYGGNLDNRIRFPLEIVESVKSSWPEEKPIFYRVSGTDWFPSGEKDPQSNQYISWGIEQTIYLCSKLQKLGIDLIDTSSGGNHPSQKIPIGPGYQVPLASQIKKSLPELLIGAVGLLTNGSQIEDILSKGDADVAFLAREWLRDPNFALTAASELGIVVATPVQYQRAFTRMYKP